MSKYFFWIFKSQLKRKLRWVHWISRKSPLQLQIRAYNPRRCFRVDSWWSQGSELLLPHCQKIYFGYLFFLKSWSRGSTCSPPVAIKIAPSSLFVLWTAARWQIPTITQQGLRIPPGANYALAPRELEPQVRTAAARNLNKPVCSRSYTCTLLATTCLNPDGGVTQENGDQRPVLAEMYEGATRIKASISKTTGLPLGWLLPSG